MISLLLAVRTVALLYHKPADLLVTHSDELNRETVYDRLLADEAVSDVQARAGRLHAVGRLDKDTTGLLLLTNDGRLVQHCTDPTIQTSARADPIYKRYVAVCRKLSEEQLSTLRLGVDLGSLGVSLPADVAVVSETKATCTCKLTIQEGKNRQVRRMLHEVGSACIRLHRESLGGLTLDGVDEGAWRLLSDAELRDGLHYSPREFDRSDDQQDARHRRRRVRRGRTSRGGSVMSRGRRPRSL